VVVFGKLSFSFKDLNEHTWLIISVGGEDLRFFGGNGGISIDEYSHNSSSSFDTHGKGGNI